MFLQFQPDEKCDKTVMKIIVKPLSPQPCLASIAWKPAIYKQLLIASIAEYVVQELKFKYVENNLFHVCKFHAKVL